MEKNIYVFLILGAVVFAGFAGYMMSPSDAPIAFDPDSESIKVELIITPNQNSETTLNTYVSGVESSNG